MVWLTVGCTVGYPLIWLFSEGFGNFSVSFEVSVHCIESTPLRTSLSSHFVKLAV